MSVCVCLTDLSLPLSLSTELSTLSPGPVGETFESNRVIKSGGEAKGGFHGEVTKNRPLFMKIRLI